MLTIWGRANSVNVQKVLWCCEELGLAYDRIDAGLQFGRNNEPDYLAMNPMGRVPTLVDGDFVLWESNSIIRYLAGRYRGESLYPGDVRERARCDQWIDWQASELNRSWSYAFLALVRHSPAHRDPQQIEASRANWARQMAIVEAQLRRTGAFIAGGAFSLADIPIALSVNRWLETPFEHDDLPAVAAYMARLAEREGYRAYCRNGTP